MPLSALHILKLTLDDSESLAQQKLVEELGQEALKDPSITAEEALVIGCKSSTDDLDLRISAIAKVSELEDKDVTTIAAALRTLNEVYRPYHDHPSGDPERIEEISEGLLDKLISSSKSIQDFIAVISLIGDLIKAQHDTVELEFVESFYSDILTEILEKTLELTKKD